LSALAEQRIERQRKQIAFSDVNTFAAAVRLFTENHRVRKTGERPKRWQETASLLGLKYPLDGSEPTVVKGGLCAVWADRPVAGITSDDIFSAIENAKRGRRGKRSESAGRHMASALASMFGWLHRNRRIQANPCAGVYRPAAPPSRDRVLSDAEVKTLWQACDAIAVPGQNTQPPWGAMVKLLLLTGCRLREIARLEESELTADMICLPAGRVKNNLPHDVPLSPSAREILEGVQRMPNCRFIFSTNGRTPVSGFSKLKKKIDALIAKRRTDDGVVAKMPPWRLHDLRRTASTRMNDFGVLPHHVEAILNHISGTRGGVAGTYNKSKYNPEKRAGLELWADHVARIVQ
jgi:integrase